MSKLEIDAEARQKAYAWYLAHTCPPWQAALIEAERAKAAGERGADVSMTRERMGVTGKVMHYEYHPSSIGSMVNAVCGLCRAVLEDIEGDY